MYRPLLLIALLALGACGSDPDKRTTAQEGQVTAKAVADVDGAMHDAMQAKPLPAAEPAPNAAPPAAPPDAPAQ